jgi:hypothetical protein
MAGALTILIVVTAFFVAGGFSAIGFLAMLALRRRARSARPWLGKTNARGRWQRAAGQRANTPTEGRPS